MPNSLSKFDDTQFTEMYLSASSARALAKELGCSRTTVTNRATKLGLSKRENGMKTKREQVRLSDADRVKIKEHYSTTPNDVLATEIGCSYDTIQYYAHKWGLRKDESLISELHRANRRGKQVDDATRQRIRHKLSGRKRDPELVRRTNETKKARGTIYAGPRHHWWNGGVVKANPQKRWADARYVVWRNAVAERDVYTCQVCGCHRPKGTGGLHAHHIIPWRHAAFRFDVLNGVMLCEQCHYREHRIPVHLRMFAYPRLP